EEEALHRNRLDQLIPFPRKLQALRLESWIVELSLEVERRELELRLRAFRGLGEEAFPCRGIAVVNEPEGGGPGSAVGGLVGIHQYRQDVGRPSFFESEERQLAHALA